MIRIMLWKEIATNIEIFGMGFYAMEQENLWLLGYPEEFYEKAVLAPDFFVDLNMDQVAAQIMAERKGYDLRKYFNRMPEELSVTKKRQEALQALETPEFFDGMAEFSDHMRLARAYAEDYQKAEREICGQKLLLDCGMQYVQALDVLVRALLKRQEEFPEMPAADGREGARPCGLFDAFLGKFQKYMEGEGFQAFRRDTVELCNEFETMVFRVEFANHRMRVVPLEGEQEGDYFDKLRSLFPENMGEGRVVRGQLENPFCAKKEVGELEFFVLTACQKKYPASFAQLRKYEQAYSVQKKRELTVQMREKGLSGQVRVPGFFEGWVLAFEQELQVYLAVELFMRRVRKMGYPLAYAGFVEEGSGPLGVPSGVDTDFAGDVSTAMEGVMSGKNTGFPAASNQMELRQAYDLALLLKQVSGKGVVCNDAYYAKQERFLVVTGPNQGGKTTFARSLGQIVYLAKMGFAAPCVFAHMPYFSGLLTHFSVEESLETGRGKLKEELMRLAPMMCGEHRGSFVVLNELFTTAATYDAYIMGRRVMEYFMAQDCFGVYVTHIQELAAGEKAQEEICAGENIGGKEACADVENWEETDLLHGKGKYRQKEGESGKEPPSAGRIVSMAACVDERDSHIRTYRIVRRAPEGVGYAYALVEKYHLTYQELKERLSKSCGT